jgi:lipoprotein-anchoring transpeptidase ErfK/SrfK
LVQTRRSRGLAAALAVVATAALASACQGGPAGPSTSNVGGSVSSTTTSSTPTATPTPAELSVSPADHSTGVLPSEPITVQATVGTLGDVNVVDAEGKAVKGDVGSDGAWKSTGLLAPSTAYTVTAKASGPDGTPSTTTSTFTTLKPKVNATYGILYSGQTVGVGAPVSIQFDSAVTDAKYRAQVEKLVKVTTTPAQKGAWGWLDNRQLMWRPAKYWVPGTKVSVSAPLTGVQTGKDKWVAHDDSASFSIGSSMISYVNIKTHQMKVTRGGQVLRTIPVSTGKPGKLTETRSGVKVIIGKQEKVTMDSATVGIPKGDPNYYKIDTKWDLRVTWTGEFLHSAPWSVGAQGSTNVSHGCTNLGPENAKWMYDNSKVGDIVVFTGSNRVFQPTEGIGVWQYSFSQWQKQSALV